MRRAVRTVVSWSAAVVVGLVVGIPLRAQDRSGVWEGAIRQGDLELLVGLKTSKAAGGSWNATLFNSSIWPQDGVSATSVTLQATVFKFSFSYGGKEYRYDGKFAPDGQSIEGTFAGGRDSFSLTFQRTAPEKMRSLDNAHHIVQFVTVQPDVTLEVLDWGGSGPPLLFIPGAGHTAHTYDQLVTNFLRRYHVYGMTRRGTGASSIPPAVAGDANGNYSSDRLGDDVLAVMEALKLDRPVLVGHSLAGEELSSVGSRHPDVVSGLIYLDAVERYSYAPAGRLMPRPPQSATPGATSVLEAIQAGQRNIDRIPTPVLAIIPVPHLDRGPADLERMTKTANDFEAGVPTARVVRLKDADHAVWMTHEADVLREMNSFLVAAFQADRPRLAAGSAVKIAEPVAVATPLSGTWEGVLRFQGPRGGDRPISLRIQLNGTDVTGTMTGGPPDGKEAPIANGKLSGDQLTFELKGKEPDGGDMWILFTGTVKGGRIEGSNAVRTADPQAPLRKMSSLWMVDRKL